MGPRQNGTASITLGGLVVVACVLAVAGYQVAQLDARIATLIRTKNQEERMQTLTETVTSQSGRTLTVTTTRGEGETIDSFIGRHNEAVNAARAL